MSRKRSNWSVERAEKQPEKTSPEAFADRLAEIWALDDAAVDLRRGQADRACCARYAPGIIGPRLLQLVGTGG